MKTDTDVARGWICKAESDLKTAEIVVAAGGPFDTACFHAQQAAEKSLKAVLCLHGVVPPRTHDVGELADGCASFLEGFVATERLLGLTEFAVGSRYDAEFWPSEETARTAMETAREVYVIALAAVGKV
jgi:HEPN domain-containing protein